MYITKEEYRTLVVIGNNNASVREIANSIMNRANTAKEKMLERQQTRAEKHRSIIEDVIKNPYPTRMEQA